MKKSLDQFLTRAFIEEKTKQFRLVNDTLSVVTIVAIGALILETVETLSAYQLWFRTIELVAVVIFSAEYLGRLRITRPRRSYVFSFFGVVDLLAIVPTLLGLGNWTFLKSARALRIIRFLRIIQLAKMSRGHNADVMNSLGIYGFSVLIYFVILVLSLLVMGTLLYLVEPTTPSFASIPSAMWWSFKVFLAGIAVPVPETAAGEFLHVLTRFVGLLLLGLLVGIVGNLFRLTLVTKRQSQPQ